MRTQQYIQVEAIVAKYKELASKNDAVKHTEESFTEFYIPDDHVRLDFVEQLIARIYKLRAGDYANADVVEQYSEAEGFYIEGLLDQKEEQYLVDNFATFVDYAMDHLSSFRVTASRFVEPGSWSCLVPYLLEGVSGKIFIPCSNDGREFMALTNCELVVGENFENAAIRALACNQNINRYTNPIDKKPLWNNLADNSFDAVIVDLRNGNLLHDEELSLEECFNACNRIVKQGGHILFCLTKDEVLSGSSLTVRDLILKEKILSEAIQLPSGSILFHMEKQIHDTFVMCDATQLSQRGRKYEVDIDTFQKEIAMANMPERDDNPVMRRYGYEKLDSRIFVPAYYLLDSQDREPLEKLAEWKTDFILSDECGVDEKVCTVNHLSNVFTKGIFNVEDLPSLKQDRLRRYYRIQGPAVIMAVSQEEIAVGYTTDTSSFLVPKNLYALKPLNGVDVKFLASKILSDDVKNLLKMLVYDRALSAKFTPDWMSMVFIPNTTDQQLFVQKTIEEDYRLQEKFAAQQEKEFKNAIHLRKHALSQNVSAFDSLFQSLEFCMSEHRGQLNASDQLSPVSQMTVGDAMSILHADLKTICDRIAHLTDDNDWGACEAIEPQEFIEQYEKLHASPNFKMKHLWEDFESNRFSKDILDKKSGKLLFHKGESMHNAWFPRKALLQIFDNIVANASQHGFKDPDRKDYVITSSWHTEGLNMVIEIANNGTPIPADVDSDLVLEYGYSTALNQRGHGGIGGGEIAQIMHKFGGSVKVSSTPDEDFTVTYVLTLPLASVY